MTTPPRLALLAGLAVLVVGLSRLDDVGPTWDLAHGEFAYAPALFEWATTGDARHLDAGWRPHAVPLREPAPSFEPAVPLAAISTPAAALAGASLRAVWTTWGLGTPTGALLLPAVLAAALLVGVVVRLAADAAGRLGGVAAAVALVAAPRVVGAAGVDLRDLPATALTMLALLVALTPPRRRRPSVVVTPRARLSDAQRRDLRAVVLGAVLGLAVAWRAASLVWFVVAPIVACAHASTRPRARAWPVALAAAAAVAWGASPDLWLHPLDVLADRVAWRASAPSPTGPGAAALLVVTTPLPLLALALGGLAATRVAARTRLALLVAVAVPLAGSAWAPVWWPADVAVVDAAVPAAVLAAFAVVALRDLWTRLVARGSVAATVGAAFALLLLAPGVATTASAWPHARLSFGHLGLGEAQRRGWPGASDRDGATTREALGWLDEHAELGADVLVLGDDRVTPRDVLLRPDLDVVGPRGLRPDPPLYVVVPLRPGRSAAHAAAARRIGALVHARQLEGAMLLEVWRVDDALDARALVDAWRADVTAPREAARAVVADASLDPVSAATLAAWLDGADGPRALLGLRALAPAELRPRVDAAIRAGLPGR